MIERTYVIPLRSEWLKIPKYKRAKKAVNSVKSFLVKHMKVEEENIKLGIALNLELWKHGIKNPPHKIKVNVQKDDKGVLKVQLFGVPFEVKEEKKEKGLKDKVLETVGIKKDEKKEETVKEVKQKVKEGEKEIKKELKKLDEKTEELKVVKKEEPKVEKRTEEKKTEVKVEKPKETTVNDLKRKELDEKTKKELKEVE